MSKERTRTLRRRQARKRTKADNVLRQATGPADGRRVAATLDQGPAAPTFDTSGVVRFDGGTLGYISWEGVGHRGGAFAQAYIEAAMRDLNERLLQPGEAGPCGVEFGFSDLASESVAQMIADCAEVLALAAHAGLRDSAQAGREFWERRQAGRYDAVIAPPLASYVAEDGKVRFKEAGDAEAP
jgi:hypothetical protein